MKQLCVKVIGAAGVIAAAAFASPYAMTAIFFARR